MKNIQIVSANEKEKLRKYFFDYLIELKEFDPNIKLDKHGKPIYKWFDSYWKDKDRYPFLLSIDNQFAGLALIRELEPKHYEIAEFYVVPRFRKDNNAIDFATQITNLLAGEYSFSTRLENLRAIRFWDKFILNFAHGGSSTDENYKNWFITTENVTKFD